MIFGSLFNLKYYSAFNKPQPFLAFHGQPSGKFAGTEDMMQPFLLLALSALQQAAAPVPQHTISLERVQVTLVEQVQVSATKAGILKDLHIREGSLVKRDQILAQIDDRDAQLHRQQVEMESEIALTQSENDVNLRYATKTKEVAQTELKRAQISVAEYRNSISPQEIDRLKLTGEQAELQIEQARRELAIAQFTHRLKEKMVEMAALDLEQRKIPAPLDGVVVELFRRRGEWVNPGDPIMRILRIDRLRVQGFLNAQQFGDEVLGCPVTLKVTLPNRAEPELFRGSVIFVSPEVEPLSGQFRIWAEVDNKNLLLKPGLSGSLTIDLSAAKTPKSNP